LPAVRNNCIRFIDAVVSYSWQLFYVITLNIALHQFAVPFIRKKRKVAVWIVLLVAVLLAMLLLGFFGWNTLGKFFLTKRDIEPVSSTFRGFTIYLMFALFGCAYFAAVRFAIDTIKLNFRNQQLLLEKKQSELNYLKSQTNPHFLFNTLNSIYSLSLDQSKQTPATILRLSEILRYMLYDADAPLVEIQKEVQIINEYVELEKIRYDNFLRVSIETDIEYQNQKIPPLLMIPLVENAFKFGTSEIINNPFIKIKLTCKNNILNLYVENSIDSSLENTTVKENIGLSNLRRQLHLQFSEYFLNIEKTDGAFTVIMNINLNSYEKYKMHHH
jgi:two-component system, LytTR family, sensor kinase